MTYTFDDAIEELEKLQGSAGYATQGEPEALRFSGLDVNWFLNEATQVIEKLRDEYAPTVEMTNYQKGLLLRYLEDLPFSDLISDVYLSRAGGAGDEHGDRYDDLSDEDIMNAWLHPETIKVVDE